ncbi:MAG: hypothetical protein QRY74_04275 [Chlamydia sp.]
MLRQMDAQELKNLLNIVRDGIVLDECDESSDMAHITMIFTKEYDSAPS